MIPLGDYSFFFSDVIVIKVTKKCDVVGISEHLRTYVFENGQYLASTSLISPRGEEIDSTILQVEEVERGGKRAFE